MEPRFWNVVQKMKECHKDIAIATSCSYHDQDVLVPYHIPSYTGIVTVLEWNHANQVSQRVEQEKTEVLHRQNIHIYNIVYIIFLPGKSDDFSSKLPKFFQKSVLFSSMAYELYTMCKGHVIVM